MADYSSLGLRDKPEVTVVEVHNRQKACCPRGEKEYRVVDPAGNRILTAKEDLDCCCRSCRCLFRRDFNILIDDAKGAQIFKMTHETMCCSWFSCCCSCCRHRIEVDSKGGQKVGSIKNDCTTCCSCFPAFSVYDEKGERHYTVKKDLDCCASMFGGCSCCCCFTAHIPRGFSIKGKAGGQIEHINSRAREEDTYRVLFPADATDQERLLLLGATFLVDYALYDAPKHEAMEK